MARAVEQGLVFEVNERAGVVQNEQYLFLPQVQRPLFQGLQYALQGWISEVTELEQRRTLLGGCGEIHDQSVGERSISQSCANSAEGKAANAKIEALVKKKQAEANPKAAPQDQQRFQQEAQQEVQKLQAELQAEFQNKLVPILRQLAQEKHLSMLLSAQDAGLIYAEPGLDLTNEAIKRLDAAPKK